MPFECDLTEASECSPNLAERPSYVLTHPSAKPTTSWLWEDTICMAVDTDVACLTTEPVALLTSINSGALVLTAIFGVALMLFENDKTG